MAVRFDLHQDIELRDLPFVEPEEAKEPTVAKVTDSSRPADIPVNVVRQQPLSIETSELLRQLEKDMRNAPSLRKLTVTEASLDTVEDTDNLSGQVVRSQ